MAPINPINPITTLGTPELRPRTPELAPPLEIPVVDSPAPAVAAIPPAAVESTPAITPATTPPPPAAPPPTFPAPELAPAPTPPAAVQPPPSPAEAPPTSPASGPAYPAYPAYPTPPTPPPYPAYPAVPQAADDPDAFDATVDRSALLGGAQALSASAVSVLAVLCPAGHVSPPHQATCRTCGRPVPTQEPFSTPRPTLGVLRLSTGDVVTLDRGVLMGRAPSVDPSTPLASRPHVVKVASPLRDVSRNHLEVILEGWHVMVRDLGTTNGTTVTLPGRGPVRLVGHDQQVLEPGAIVALADEVTFGFEVG